MRLRGSWFVVPTAFDDRGGLDLDRQARVVDSAIRWGVDGLTAMGVTSEAAALSVPERDRALRAIVDAVSGRVPLAIGCSGPSLPDVEANVEQAAALGASAVMVAAPPSNSEATALPRFFELVARRSRVPLVIQDEPAATGTEMPVAVLLACLGASGARTVKLEDPPTAVKLAALLAAEPGLDVFGGLGGLHALAELRHGACGTMTGFAFPEILRSVRTRLEAEDPKTAARIFDRALPLIAFEAQPRIGLAIRKELLRRRGALASAAVRIGLPLDAGTAADLDDVLDRVGIVPSPDPLDVGAW